ncbi:MAG: ABC transporter permease [Sedimentisphaerales bacterium]|nr:ABC transporter permease [Sedimentisphaerales bacterium]
MLKLALANLTHRKIRSALSVLAVAIAITLLLVLVGLSRGTLNEVSNRMQSVQAEIIVRDKHFDLGSMSGGKLWEKEIADIVRIQIDDTPAVEHVMAVFLDRMKLAGLSQNVFGVHPEDFAFFAGSRRLIKGEIFSDVDSPSAALALAEAKSNRKIILDSASTTSEPLNYLPLIIDQRLAAASQLAVGDPVSYGDSPAKIVAVVETGVAGRVFAPINMLRGANGVAAQTAHMFFVKANPSLNTDQLQKLCEQIHSNIRRDATLVANYGQVIAENFRNLTIFMNLVSVIALVICFLFILVTIYTIVLERGKEIAILQSLGASRLRVLGQTVQESLIICSTGTVLGIILTFVVRYLIETLQPLMTIEVRISWILIAVLVGIGGGILSALYPGYIALSHDPVEALSFE